ncbi:MAG: hypothetical protein GY861_10880 [bacterium]|nr:hypothetical protein [bacterium]
MNLFNWGIFKKDENVKPIKPSTLFLLRELCDKQLGLPNNLVFDESVTRDQLQMDSLDDVELLLAIEDEWDIDIRDEDWEKCNSVGDVINLINSITCKETT